MTFIRLTQFTSLSPLIFLLFIVVGVLLGINFHDPITDHTLRIAAAGALLLLIAPAILMWTTETRMSPSCSKETGVCGRFGSGPYKYSRHPKHVGFVMLVIGLGLVMNSWILIATALVSVIFFTFVIIPYEERVLLEQFPNEYGAYRKKVRMWF